VCRGEAGKRAVRFPLARLLDFAHISKLQGGRKGAVQLALQFGPGED
jgi:hypothetical protein